MASSVRRRRDSGDFRTVSACGVALLVAMLSSAPVARAAGGPAPGNPGIAERPGVFRLQVARDPETGGWTLAPLSAASAFGRSAEGDAQWALNQSSEGLFTEALPGGGFRMDLQGRFQSYSVARREADGATRFECGENPLSLFHWLTDPPADLDAAGRPTR